MKLKTEATIFFFYLSHHSPGLFLYGREISSIFPQPAHLEEVDDTGTPRSVFPTVKPKKNQIRKSLKFLSAVFIKFKIKLASLYATLHSHWQFCGL